MEGVETDDTALELEKWKRMNRYKNLNIKFIINIYKKQKIKELNYTGFWSKIRSSELRLDSIKY